MHLAVAGKLTGPLTKWLVLAAWVVIVAVASGFAMKLTDVQNNEASSWLPDTAESTKALAKLAPFSDQNDIPTIVVYHRSGGLTDADYTAIAEQATGIGAIDGAVPGTNGRPTVAFPTDAANNISNAAVCNTYTPVAATWYRSTS